MPLVEDNYYITLGTEIVEVYEKYEKNNKIHISIIGRITEEKIPIIFFENLCNLSNKIKDTIEIHIYGEKDIKFNNDYVIKFDQLISKSSIILHNFISPYNIYYIYEKTNILLIPSIYETGSFTCIEAFSYGIPVISRNVYGLKSLINDGINGYLCNNDYDIFNKIENIRNDKILKNNKIIREYSLQYNIIDKIKDFEDIIENNVNIELINNSCIIVTSVINCSNTPLPVAANSSDDDVKKLLFPLFILKFT
jgi:glycosyltransferase involved in cell wall biosynthesis